MGWRQLGGTGATRNDLMIAEVYASGRGILR